MSKDDNLDKPADNSKLLNEILKASKGNIPNRHHAIDLLFEFHRKDPEAAISLLKKLASSDQPKEVRHYVAKKMQKGGLVTFEYYDLLKILLNNPDKELAAFIVTTSQPIYSQANFQNSLGNTFFDSLKSQRLALDGLFSRPFHINEKPFLSITQDITKNHNLFVDELSKIHKKLAQDLNRGITTAGSRSFGDILKSQRNVFSFNNASAFQSINESMSRLMKATAEKQNKWLKEVGSFGSAKPFVSFIDVNNLALSPLKEQIRRTAGYYSPQELESVKSPPATPSNKKAQSLISRLKECKPGIPDWNKYQDICEEILTYCMVPPLLEPIPQSRTRDGMHIRDLIFHIPHGLSDFWTYLISKYGTAIIVECKNYTDTLSENELIISSKYYGKKKLTNLGLILTRKGLSNNGLKTQEKLWDKEDKMLLVLTDEDLMKMLELKDKGDEPWMIIDLHERQFLSSLT
jgi:hypothetical protein